MVSLGTSLQGEQYYTLMYQVTFLLLHTAIAIAYCIKLHSSYRLCIYCRSQAVEDEQHFLLQCPLYNNERRLIETVNAAIPLFHLLPENEKFSTVMQSKTPKVMKALGNYIFTCLKKRGVSTAANQNPP